MSQAAADALKAARDTLRAFDQDLTQATGPEWRSALAQEQLAKEAILIRGEIAALRIMLSEALDKFMR